MILICFMYIIEGNHHLHQTFIEKANSLTLKFSFLVIKSLKHFIFPQYFFYNFLFIFSTFRNKHRKKYKI